MPAPRRRHGARSASCPGCLPARTAPDPAGLSPGAPPESVCFHPPGDVAASSTEGGHTGVAGLRALEGRSHGRPRLLPGPSGAARHPRASVRHLSRGLGTPDFFVSLSWFSLGHSEAISSFPCVCLTHPRAFRTRGADVGRYQRPRRVASWECSQLPGRPSPGVPPPPRAPIPPPPAPTLASLNFSPRTPAP